MYPPGYGGMPPGYAQPGYGYPQQPGMYAPPPPGMMGYTMGSAQGQPGATAAGASLFGMGAINTALQAPGMALGALGTLSMAAPILRYGGGALPGALGTGMQAVGTVLDELDPMSMAFRAMGGGGRAGGAVGNALGGAARLGAGSAGRMGMMGAGMGIGSMAAVGIPMAAAYAGYEGARFAGNQIMTGARQSVQAQTLMNQINVPGMTGAGGGAQMSDMMRDMSRDLGVSFEDVGKYAKELDQQRVFQTAKDAKEFQQKFKSVMKAVKDIAKMTQTTVDDATAMFSDLRQQGFYTTADIKAQAASTRAREMSTGISGATYSAIGQAGAQTARQFGMRGRYGAEAAQRSVAGVAMGVRSGRMDEETVMEMGGTEAVGMRLAQRQMQFLGTARGRAIIAATMGRGGAPDTERLGQFLGGGMTMENLVTTAAGRGLGVMQQAGTREAREKFMPYASMAMVQMAASQQKQLYGRTDQAGTLRMMRTMGMGQDEAQLMFQQAMGMGEQLSQEQAAKTTMANREQAATLRQQTSMVGQSRRMFQAGVTDPLQRTGAAVQERLAGTYTRFMQDIGAAPTEYSTGGEATRRRLIGLTAGDLSLSPAQAAKEQSLAALGQRGSFGTQTILGAAGVLGRRGGLTRGRSGTILGGLSAAELQEAEAGMARGQDIRFTEDRVARLQYAREVEGRDLGGIDSFSGALGNFGRAVRGDVTRGYREGGVLGALGGLTSGQSFRTQALQQSIAVMEAAGFDKFQGATVEDIRKGGIGQEMGVITTGMRLAAEAGIKSPLGAIPGLGMFGMGQAEQTRRGSDVVRGAVTDLFGDARARVGSEVVGDIFSAKGIAKGVLSGGGLTAMDLISGVGKVLEQGTAQDAFTKKLATDPEAGALLQEYIAAEAEDADPAVKMQALNALKERLGSEAESFMPQIYAALGDKGPGGKREKLLKSFGPGGDFSKYLDRAAFGKATEGKRTRISTLKTAEMERKKGYSKELMGRIKDLKTTISRELAKGDQQDFGVQAAAVQTFIKQAAIDRDIDPEEMEALTDIFGVEGAEAGQIMKDALSGRLSKEQQKKYNISDKELEGVRSGDTEALQAIAGKLAMGALQAPGGTKAEEGSPQAYAEANTKFVKTVHAFLSAVGSAKIKGIPEFPGPGESGSADMEANSPGGLAGEDLGSN